MSGIEIALLATSAAAAIGSAGLAGAATIAQGNAEYAAAKAQQDNLNKMASEELAVATRAADQKARETKLLQSRGQAVAAASGGGALDPTVMEIAGNVARDANVQERDLLRTGQVKANDLMYQGAVNVANAKANRGLSRLVAGGQIAGGVADALSTGASAYAKYGGSGPASAPGSPSTGSDVWYR